LIERGQHHREDQSREDAMAQPVSDMIDAIQKKSAMRIGMFLSKVDWRAESVDMNTTGHGTRTRKVANAVPRKEAPHASRSLLAALPYYATPFLCLTFLTVDAGLLAVFYLSFRFKVDRRAMASVP
jgi:hypothetical protein